jgi:putative ABC transport system permease protein
MATLDRTASFPYPISSRLRGRSGLWITFREAFWVAIEALRAHKLRSFLTLLGVVIATTTLIVVMSIINGMNLYISEHLANLGANVFIVNRFQWAQGYQAWLAAHRRNKPIRVEDFEFLRDNLAGYKNIGVRDDMQNDNNFVRYQGHTKYSQDIAGVTPSMIDIGSQKVQSGRYVNESEYDHESMVCFIGHDLVDEFFANSDPLGKEILINNLPFRVIGTAERIGNTFGQSQDNFVIVPMTAYLKFFVPHPADVDINVQAYDGAQMLALEDEARALLRARRHVPYREPDNFGINASQTIMDLWNRLLGSIFAVTIGIVSVFMLVGGIVIMNIMLASVTERTHEIGIRKSLGARRGDILAQFVMESIVMSGVGGAIGVVLAFVVSSVVNRYWTSSVPLRAVLVGLGLSSAVGLFFGIYPASQAAKLNPIDALRTET